MAVYDNGESVIPSPDTVIDEVSSYAKGFRLGDSVLPEDAEKNFLTFCRILLSSVST